MSARFGQGGLSGLVAWCVGIALQLQQETLWPLTSYAALVTLACGVGGWVYWCQPSFWPKTLAVWALCVGFSFAVTGLHALSRAQTIHPALEGQDLDVVGVVQAMPQRQDMGWRFRFRIEQAWRTEKSGPSQKVDLNTELPTQVYLGWYGDEGRNDSGWKLSALPEPVKAGERWRLRVRLKAPHGHLNPRGFDYELWLWEQNIRATGYVRTGAQDPSPQRLASTGLHPIEGWRQSVRDRLLTHLATAPGGAASAQHSGVVAALVTGDQAAIERSDWDLFRATGVAHLMSISGLHVTMFAWLASLVVAWGWRKSALWGFQGALRWPAPQVGALAGLVLAGLYALFSGWGVPAQRTMGMLAVVVVLQLSARLWPGPLVWALAGAVVLTCDPWALLQPGFWLSFVAVGVLMATGRDQTPAPAPSWPHAGAGRALALLREQFIVTLALAPLGLLFFGQVSWVGLIANLLAIPWVTFLVTPLAMLGVVWSGAWDLAVGALQPLTMVLTWMASGPSPVWSMPMAPWGFAAIALLGAVLWVLRVPLTWKVLAVPLLWPVLFWQAPRPAAGSFELLAADVGQGNAVLVRTARHSLLYDAGPRYSPESDAGHRVLVPLLAQSGERLNMLMLSHRDSDHTGGAAAVLSMQPQAALWSSLEENHPLHALRAGWTRCQAGQSWVWDGVRFDILHPPAQAAEALTNKKPKPNAISCVLRISQGTASALLAGDIEAAQELALVASGLQTVDLLLVPHHGSQTSSTSPFLQALQPQVAVVQAGYRNRYGHPAAPVVARFRAQGVQWVENTRCGAARWLSSEPQVVHCERVLAKRYWHHTQTP